MSVYPTLKSGPPMAHKWAAGHSPASVFGHILARLQWISDSGCGTRNRAPSQTAARRTSAGAGSVLGRAGAWSVSFTGWPKPAAGTRASFLRSRFGLFRFCVLISQVHILPANAHKATGIESGGKSQTILRKNLQGFFR